MKLQPVFALLSGLVFGFGLSVSQMINPAKVLNFLDVAGSWDPSLALVMGGALLVMAVAWQLQKKRSRPLFGDRFFLPTLTAVDAPLLLGAALFGMGWGLAGFCPGPALAALSLLRPEPVIFVAAMLAGMGLQGLLRRGS